MSQRLLRIKKKKREKTTIIRLVKDLQNKVNLQKGVLPTLYRRGGNIRPAGQIRPTTQKFLAHDVCLAKNQLMQKKQV